MASKRMFDKEVINTDGFLDLPMEAKALYFLLGMEADDEGFINPKKVIRLYGGTEDSIKILILKGFIIPFESGVVVITDWKRNNWLDKRRIKETIYLDEKSKINYNEMTNKYEYLASAKQMLRENRIEEYSIDKNSIDDEDNIYTYYENNIGILTPRQYEIISNYINEFNEDIIKEAINRASDNNGKSFKYVEAILKSWKSKGYKTLGEIQNEKKTKKVIDIPEWIDKKIDKEELDPLELQKLEKEMSIFT
jgi:DnaD/phage-associated family protein